MRDSNKKNTENTKKELDNRVVEKIFEVIWNNWSSRRRCEQTHAPEYLKKKNIERINKK